MIRTTKVYEDRRTGGLRLYIPFEMAQQLKWGDHDQVILTVEDGQLKIVRDSPSMRTKEAGFPF